MVLGGKINRVPLNVENVVVLIVLIVEPKTAADDVHILDTVVVFAAIVVVKAGRVQGASLS